MAHDATHTATSHCDADTTTPLAPSTQVSANLHQQCNSLLAELDELQTLLKGTLRNPQLVEVRQFRSNVNSELKMLQKLEQRMQNNAAALTDETDPELEKRLLHAMRSSNLPFYQAVWDIAKTSCVGLVALGKRFYWDGEVNVPETKQGAGQDAKRGAQGKDGGGWEKQPNKDKRKSVFVDIVAGDGEEWVKVSTISESRLLFDMAKKGWERESEDEFLSDDEGRVKRTILRNFDRSDDEDDDSDELELIKLARDLRKAANATRVRYRHPRLRIILPKIMEGVVPEIDDILKEMRSYGIKVECQNSLSSASATNLTHLLPQHFKNFTPTLNVDCTLLLAMVSDLSHVKDMPPSPSFHRAIVRQIEVEKEKPLLPTELWPAMGDHELVSTEEASTRMREIVDTIGTETEQTRMRIMMGHAPYDQLNRESLIQKFAELSDYEVPKNWKIPLKVVQAQPVIDTAKAEGRLPSVAEEVAAGLSDINHSVFMYGWATGMTTISSNRTIDKQIEATIENSRQGDDDSEGPLVWICDTARSLVGKDKDRKE
jgi:hypothetical protein